jgi:peroxiredoxin
LAWFVVGASFCLAGKFNERRSIGDDAPVWVDLPGTDDGKHSLADWKDRECILVVFTCNSCPYAVDYEVRINELAKRYAGKEGKVAVVAINCNTIPADDLPAMKQRAKERNFAFPYLHDPSQQIAREYGAVRTPECFVLDRQRKIVYMGALDDHTDPAKVQHHYAREAIEAVLAGKEIRQAESPPVGCLIRFARSQKNK